MRVRPLRAQRHRPVGAWIRRAPGAPRREPAPDPGAAPEPDAAPAADEHADERRVREAGGPIDRARYSCACGYVFEADVTTSVTCPHCGAGQAW